ncbi:MAG TPA: YezD family protein [Candidatus Hydrogenedentes bacterium]|nr:YezD family protein [Candidatus Hydrogenedentota bacterium]HQE81406.1 YezD family protein [Candidatus Hydrogenedentota bacterium]HQH54492.1 YezD family protein [Candidatus Hydrogenedentota bacterium]HQM48149.1 YezD family protein [Candidatus Hydrogenedentota bacterium]
MSSKSAGTLDSAIAGRFAPLDASTAEAILAAVASLRFGSVEVIVHDGRVVQVEKRERVRLSIP